MRELLLVGVLASTGCVGTFETARSNAMKARFNAITLGTPPAARDAEHCANIDRRHEVLEFSAWMSGLAAGATGAVAGALTGPDPATRDTRLWLGVSSAILATTAATTAVLAGKAATQWSAECSL